MDLQEEAQKYYWYHCIDLGGGFVEERHEMLGREVIDQLRLLRAKAGIVQLCIDRRIWFDDVVRRFDVIVVR